MNMRSFFIFSFVFLSFFVGVVDVVPTVHATTNIGTTLLNPLGTTNCNPANTCLMNLLNSILDFVINIGAVVVILMMVYVGFLFVTARGEPGKISEAKSAFLWTVIGALVLLGAKAIAEGIRATVEALSVGH